jgi:hypothetical protein
MDDRSSCLTRCEWFDIKLSVLRDKDILLCLLVKQFKYFIFFEKNKKLLTLTVGLAVYAWQHFYAKGNVACVDSKMSTVTMTVGTAYADGMSSSADGRHLDYML